MLAMKLHKKKNPNLRKGSFLIPIMTWGQGKGLVKAWIHLLGDKRPGNPNNRINYITLLKIPDHHPVFLAVDWSEKFLVDVKFLPFSEISREKKERVAITEMLPEMIIGENLPQSAIKWTKDIRLLYRK